MRETAEIEQAMRNYGDAVWRMCYVHFHNKEDAEDAYQETFLRFAQANQTVFENGEHRKAWLLRVAANVCKDMLRSPDRQHENKDDMAAEAGVTEKSRSDSDSSLSEILDAMARLDDPPRTPLYLSLYEGYRARDIAEMLDAPENTVYSWISRGKKTLREALR